MDAPPAATPDKTATHVPTALTTSPPATPTLTIRKRAVFGWVLYDLANTIFSMGVITVNFPLLISDKYGQIKANAGHADVVYGLLTAVSMAIVFVLSPLLGAMTDRTRTRMPFLIGATVICVILTALLGRLGFVISAGCFIFANISFQAGVQFYDALLPSVSTPKNRGFIGGLGVGIGYAGSFIAVGLGFFTNDMALRFTLIAVAFALFALPCFLLVREQLNPRPGRINWEMVRGSTQQTLQTLRDTRQFPGLLRFLIARIFYTDAINTVIAVMMLFVMNVARAAGAGDASAKTAGNFVMIFAISFAILGGLSWGVLVDRIGSRKVLLIVLGLWCGVLLLAAAIGFEAWPVWSLYILGPLAGIALGGTWAADRPYMLLLTPPERVGEFYGLYGMVGRFAAITGPALWAIITFAALHAGLPALTGQALALLALLLMILIAAIIFAKGPHAKPELSQ